MQRSGNVFTQVYQRLKGINDRIIGVVATIIFTVLYLLVLPWFVVFVKKPRTKAQWLPWTFKSDTIKDLHKQY